MRIYTLRERPDLRDDVIDMFFETSSVQAFESERKKTAFRAKWLDYYIDKEPQHTFVAVHDSGRAMGYITGCFNSAAATELFDKVESYKVFASLYNQYPAHLHINVRSEFRSVGLGGILLEKLELACRRSGVRGLHLVTAEGNRNVSFYEKYGFAEAARAEVNGRTLLMMGKRLKPPEIG